MKTTEIIGGGGGEVEAMSGMPVEHAENRNMVFPEQWGAVGYIGMKNSNSHTIPLSMISGVQLGPPAHSAELFGEWQQRGPETLSGHVVRKLRLTLAPPRSVVTANAPGGEELP